MSDRDTLIALQSQLATASALISAQLAIPAPVVVPPPSGPVESPDGSTITDTTGSLVIKGVTYTLTKSGQIATNGKADPVTGNVTLLLRLSDTLWQQATSKGLWWSLGPQGWSQAQSNDPRAPTVAPTPTPSSGPQNGSGAKPTLTVPAGDTYSLVFEQTGREPFDIGDSGHDWSNGFPWGANHFPATSPGDGFIHCPVSPQGDSNAHSSWINAQGGTFFRGGIYEMRAKLLPGWNSFWFYGAYHILGGAKSGDPRTHTGEVDVMETDGNSGSLIVCTIHTNSDGSNNPVGDSQTGPQVSPPWLNHYDGNFHTYSVIWRQDYVEWWCDGHNLGRANSYPETWQFMAMVFGSGVGGVRGNPNTAIGDVLVDYVRGWQRPGIDAMLPKGNYSAADILAHE